MDAVAYEYGRRGTLAYEAGDVDHAIMCFTLGIKETPPSKPALASQLLGDRADCYWTYGQKEEACNDLKRAVDIYPGYKCDPHKWVSRGHECMKEENYTVAAQCFSYALYFAGNNLAMQATLYALRAEANYKMGKVAEARKDISACGKTDSSLLRQHGRCFKETAIQLYKMHIYNKAVVLFGLALEFLPKSLSELHAQVHSYLACCHFSLQQYPEALEAGKEAYKIKPGRSQGEARRWKERGKQLFKENRFDLLVKYYSMAINYAPTSDRELLAQLLCNRSLVHIKNKAFDLAVLDAEGCVKIQPHWSKAHYRLGSSLLAMKRYQDSMDSFAVALDLAETDDEKYDTLTQIITVALELEYGTSLSLVDENAFLPTSIVQRAVDDAVLKKDWERLHVLFLGGGGPTKALYGEGGIASGCETSHIPLDLVISSNVSNKTSLVAALVNNGALVDGLSLCKKPPLLVAMEMEEYSISTLLLEKGANIACTSQLSHLKLKEHAMYWKRRAIIKFCRDEDDVKAALLFNFALQCAPPQASVLKWECLDFLSEIHFKRKEFAQCVECGVKGFSVRPTKSEELARKWRKRGNELFKDKQYDTVIDYYSLAIDYVPPAKDSTTELIGVLLSNRCAAYINLKKYDKAMADARKCVQTRPGWSKGYYRLGTCSSALGQIAEALKHFCEGLKTANTDDDKFALATHIISTAMILKDGALGITSRIPRSIIHGLLKDICNKKEWEKLHLLFLGGDSQRSYGKGRGGVATGCNAELVPIDQVLTSNVADRGKLIAVLLDHGALANGLNGCEKPPFLLALEMEEYAVAHTLLKHGADPSVVGDYRVPTLYHRESQGHYWKEEGLKALNAKEFLRAVQLLNLCLQFPSSTADFRCQVNSALATAYFEMKLYTKAVEKGRECFELKPTKSHLEASKWKERGKKLFSEKQYSILVDYYTLSMQYVPSNDKEFLATLLCNRALAYYNIGNYQQGLADAKSCTTFRSEWFKGFVRQGYCHSCLDQNREAVRAFGEGLKRAENDEDKLVILSQIASLAVHLEDGTSSVTCVVPNPTLEKLIKQLVDKRAWDQLHVLYLGGGGPQRYAPGEGGLATGMDASSVPIEFVIGAGGKYRTPLITALLENGASPDGLKKKNRFPLEMAIENEDFNLAVLLLQYNADSACIVSKKGDSLLHEALKRVFATGSNGLFLALLDSGLCDPDVTDETGNTLFHLVAFGKCSRRKCEVLNVLSKAGANPRVKNAEGKLPIDYMSKKDPRAKLIRAAYNAYKSGKKSLGTKRKRRVAKTEIPSVPKTVQSQEDGEPEWSTCASESVSDYNDQDVEDKEREKKPIPVVPAHAKRDPLDELRDHVRNMISNVPSESLQASRNEDESDSERAMVAREDAQSVALQEKDSEAAANAIPDIETIVDEDEEDDDLTKEELEVDLQLPFEDLPWEVDCTDQFWKALQNRNVSDTLKRRIIGKIRMLAEGRWIGKLCRRLDGLPRKRNIMLFDAKLTRSSRIIWELAIAFSAKCSNDPEIRVQAESSAGRVYSEIIRVWDVAANYDSLLAKVETIVQSHDRGLHCIVKKELSGFRKNEGKLTNSFERLPNFFVEVSEKVEDFSIPKPTKVDNLLSKSKMNGTQFFFPPASPNNMEFHILKFYSFSSALINSVLSSRSTARVDFPFRVTELEHAIINLRPKPPSPIILLGRSGTGKTTCCLYRLWNEFQSYWEKAEEAGPHLPRIAQFIPKVDASSSSIFVEHEETSFRCRDFTDGESDTDPASSDEFVRAIDARRRDFEEEGDASLDPSVFDETNATHYEHLHQVFVTKNPVLCSEVQKNFSELSHACPEASEHVENEDHATPLRIQDIDDAAWPLFITSRDWLLLLDASLPGLAFFPRAEDGSLLRPISGWGEEDTHLVAIEEDSDSETEDHGEIADGADPARMDNSARVDPKTFDPRREVTYFVFASELWPKITKKAKAQYHPTLVWTEIRSFIKGSIEALHTEKGHLSLKEYVDLGRKRAPNFIADREIVYSIFRVYEQTKSSLRMFDEADVVYKVYTRLQKVQIPEWSVHRFYVDETQDFTQAELTLLIRCSRDPNGLFFTGDTAQSIMRGIAFRFNDLKSLFFYSQQSYQAMGFQSGVQVPNRLYQLTHNYRSHAGILRLASSVVDLLLFYFPDSFDRLEKDQGLFDGPKPVLLESCSFGDLAMILRGNRRQSSRIEFGAHQVILVSSEEARATMPDELKHGLILTIYESKGLEFDDVLIYNFFKDSQARKEWRVVTTYMKELASGNVPNTSEFVELSEEQLESRSRPLEFDPDKHKVLNSEFKFLYTAITRARVNVWFFDEDEEARAPVFEYFQNLDIVRVFRMSGEVDEAEKLTSMFVEKSTEAEWRQQGHYFYNKELWEVAVKCFSMAGDGLMVRKSQAQLQAAEACKLRANPKNMRAQFLRAADQFLQCAMLDEGAKCLHNARERVLLALLNRKLGKFEDAAKQFKKERLYLEASECFEMVNDYHQAVEALCQGNLYEQAIDVIQRYKSLAAVETSKGGMRPPNESRTMERLCHQLAEEHFCCGRLEEMVSVLSRLPSADDRILFLENHGCVQEAVEVLIDEGRYRDAGYLLRKSGRFIEAIKFVRDRRFVAECFLSVAHCVLSHGASQEYADLVEGPAQTALELFDECDDKNGAAQCILMLAKLREDVEGIQYARDLFNKVNNICGELYAAIALFPLTRDLLQSDVHSSFLKPLERVFNLVLALNKPQNSAAEVQIVEICEAYFGLFRGDQTDTRCAFVKSASLFASAIPHSPSEVRANKLVLDVSVARWRISSYLCGLAAKLVKEISDNLSETIEANTVCNRSLIGMFCPQGRCKLLHTPFSKPRFDLLYNTILTWVHLNSIVNSFINAFSRFDQNRQITERLQTTDVKDFRACRQFHNLIFPKMGFHVSFLSRDLVRSLRKNGAIKWRLSNYAEFLWKTSRELDRWQNSDRFIEVTRMFNLVGHPGKVAFLLSAEERHFANKDVPCDAMLEHKETKGVYSFFRLFEDGQRMLYRYNDIVNSTFFFIRRYLSVIARRSSIPLPSLANTCSILEQQLIACLALFTWLLNEYEYPFCLPESYIDVVDVWGAVHNMERFHGLYGIVEVSASRVPPFKGICQVHSLLEYMVQLVCGRISRRFNVVDNAFRVNGPDRLMSGETERVLILVMTMLCNYGRGIPPVASCYCLIESLRSLPVHPFLPSRVQKALEGLRNSEGVKDVVVALQMLLFERGERLLSARWGNRRLLYEVVNLTSYTQPFIHPSSTAPPPPGTAQLPMDIDAPSEFQIPSEYLEEQRQEQALEAKRESAALVIQRWLRAAIASKKKNRVKESIGCEDDFLDPVYDAKVRFEQFKVDRSAYSVCGVHFSDTHDTEVSDERESYELHIQPNSSHWLKVQGLNDYKELYVNKLAPLFAAEQEVRKRLNATLFREDGLGSHDFGLDLQRLGHVSARVGEIIRDIECNCKWYETRRLLLEMELFRDMIKKVHDIVLKDAPSRLEGFATGADEPMHETEEYGDEEELLELGPTKRRVGKTGGKGGKQSTKKRNRGRQGKDGKGFRQA